MSGALRILIFGVVVAVFFAIIGDDLLVIGDHARERPDVEVTVENGILSQNSPAESEAYSGDYIQIPRQSDGHYWLNINVDGTDVLFVVDTGASKLSLSYEDAVSVGLNPDDLSYNKPYRTANGLTYKAGVTLNNVSVGPIDMYDVQATVSRQGQLPVSLLGMSFLNRLEGFEIRDGELLLRP